MTAIDSVYQFIFNKGIANIDQLVRGTGYAKSTVQHALTELVNAGIIDRIDRGIYTVEDIELQVYRHYVSVLAYCSNDKETLYALTYADFDSNIESQLLGAIIEETIDSCGNHKEIGYEISESDHEVTYPDIEVGGL